MDTPNILVAQGYVPNTCTLHPELAMLLFMAEMLRDATYDPCAGCNSDRAICKGRPKQESPRRDLGRIYNG